VCGDVQDAKGAPSSWHRKVESGSVDENVNVGRSSPDKVDGPWLIVVLGGFASVNVAVTVVAVVTVTMHVPVPEQLPPDQPLKL
jgi:hypothetical protein